MANQFADPSNIQQGQSSDSLSVAPVQVVTQSAPNNTVPSQGLPIGGGEPQSDSSPLFKTELAHQSLDNPEAHKDETGDPSNIANLYDVKNFMGSNISVPAFSDSQARTIGDNLDQFTQQHLNVRYDFGSKDLSNGGIDCSGWVATNTLHAMDSMNQQYGKPIYDTAKMKSLMSQGAAYQIDSIGKLAGYTSEEDIRAGRVTNGMLIGVQRQNIPSWASDRPMGISHIGQVVIKADGSKWVSESSGSGVKLTPYNDFINKPTVKHLYGTNPFNNVSTTYMATQK